MLKNIFFCLIVYGPLRCILKSKTVTEYRHHCIDTYADHFLLKGGGANRNSMLIYNVILIIFIFIQLEIYWKQELPIALFMQRNLSAIMQHELFMTGLSEVNFSTRAG